MSTLLLTRTHPNSVRTEMIPPIVVVTVIVVVVDVVRILVMVELIVDRVSNVLVDTPVTVTVVRRV